MSNVHCERIKYLCDQLAACLSRDRHICFDLKLTKKYEYFYYAYNGVIFFSRACNIILIFFFSFQYGFLKWLSWANALGM